MIQPRINTDRHILPPVKSLMPKCEIILNGNLIIPRTLYNQHRLRQLRGSLRRMIRTQIPPVTLRSHALH